MVSLNLDPVKSVDKRGALFLDRDGTLIEHIPYLHDPGKVRVLPGVREALQAAIESQYLLFLFTNQSGVGRGFFSLEEALACNAEVVRQLRLPDPAFAAECTAPEHPESLITYRKPEPHFILEMMRLYAFNPEQCCMIGDKPVDMEAGARAGIVAHQVTPSRPLAVIVRQILEAGKSL